MRKMQESLLPFVSYRISEGGGNYALCSGEEALCGGCGYRRHRRGRIRTAEHSYLKGSGKRNRDKEYKKQKNSGRVKTLPLFFA